MLPGKTRIILLASILALACQGTAALAQRPRPPAQRQTVPHKELEARFDKARQLAREHKYEEALKEYLFVFDNSREDRSYGGVRLSYVPSEIAEIGRVYPPATLALEVRRNQSEKKILAGKAEFIDLQEFTTLNQYLGTLERNIELFDKLKTLGSAFTEIKANMLTLVWGELVEAKRYNELNENVNQLARGVVSQIAESLINNDFPSSDPRGSPMYLAYLRRSIIDDGGRVYEALLGLGKFETADKLETWMLTYAPDGEMHAQLIRRAINAKRNTRANDLFNRANRTLKKREDLQLVHDAAKGLPAAP